MPGPCHANGMVDLKLIIRFLLDWLSFLYGGQIPGQVGGSLWHTTSSLPTSDLGDGASPCRLQWVRLQVGPGSAHARS